MRDELLDLIRRNRISTVEVADALGKTGVLTGISSLNPGHFVAGEVFYTCAWDESNWSLHEQIQELPEHSMVFVDTFRCAEHAPFGDLVTKYLVLYRRAAGIVVEGHVRDAHRLRKERYPLWCKGVTPLGCYNRQVEQDQEVAEYLERRRTKFDGAILIADDSGCTLIEANQQTRELYEALEATELREDIWYFCIDTLKLSTFDAVCRQVYRHHDELLPETLRDRVNKTRRDDP